MIPVVYAECHCLLVEGRTSAEGGEFCMSSYTFSELQWHYMTGQSYVVSGTGCNRVMGYRHGVM